MSERDEFLRGFGGSKFEEIRQGGQSALNLLDHPDQNVRGAALIQLAKNCPAELKDEFALKCRRIAAHDTDQSNQINAADALGRLHQRTKDAAVSRLLAKIIISCNVAIPLRSFAYLALREVQYGTNPTDMIKRIELLERWSARPRPSAHEDVLTGRAVDHPGEDDPELCEIDFDFVRRFVQ